MEIINLGNGNLTFHSFLKSGNNQFRATLSHVFEDVKYTENIEKKSFIFVRNPIHRFISSYFFLQKFATNKGSDFEKETLEIKTKYEINDIQSFINEYENIMESCHDYHYLPQTFEIKRDIKDIDFNEEYKNKFGDNYHIIRIEDVEYIVNLNNLIINSQANLDSSNIELNKLSFLNDFEDKINYNFVVYYLFFKGILDQRHNLNVNRNKILTHEQYDKLYDIFKYEIEFFGYKMDYDKKII